MSEIAITCSKCGSEFLIDEAHAGSTVACSQCQSTILVPLAGIKPGTKIADFEVVKKLGVGGMGEVWLAKQVSMDRDVALKILSPALADNEDFVTRFSQEVKMAGKLTHPNIVGAHYAGVDNGIHFLAISFVDGVELEDLMKEQKVILEKQALEIAKSMANALKYAWDKFKILHRDIKPSNIMINSDDEPMLMDMGISKSLAEDKNLTMTGMVVGTPYYMSPEQCRADSKLDFRADLYSLGATLYHMLTGSVPFDATNVTGIIAKQITEPFPSPQERNPEISDQCAVLLEIMMAKQPDERQATWDDLIKDIDLVLEGQFPVTSRPQVGMSNVMQVGYTPGQTHHGNAVVQKENSSKTPIVIVGLVTVLVLLSVIVTVVLLGKKDGEQELEKENIEPRKAAQVSNLSRKGVMSNVQHRKTEPPSPLPKKDYSGKTEQLKAVKLPVNFFKVIQKARTKTGEIVKANPKNIKDVVKRLKSGNVLYCEPGIYKNREVIKIVCDKIIVEGKEGKEASGLALNIVSDECVIRNLNAHNLELSGKVTVVDSSIKSGLGMSKGDVLIFNSHISRYYPAYAKNGSIKFVNCTLHSPFHCNWIPIICKGAIDSIFSNCVIATNSLEQNLVIIMPNFNKKLKFESCLLSPVEHFGAVSSDYVPGDDKLYKSYLEMEKWISVSKCLRQMPKFVDAAKNNFKLAASSPGRGACPDGRDLGANFDKNGFPVAYKGGFTARQPAKGEAAIAAELHAALKKTNPKYQGDGKFGFYEGQIIEIKLWNKPISDISPLKKITSLRKLWISSTEVHDLSPLKGMKLRYLDASKTPISDLMPLKGMRFDAGLSFGRCPKLKTLEPLRGMHIYTLYVGEDFGAKTPLPGYDKLDLSPLAECRGLVRLGIPVNPLNIEKLRNLPKLEKIRFRGQEIPVSDFWKKYDAGEYGLKAGPGSIRGQ